MAANPHSPIDAVRARLSEAGAGAGPLRDVLALLLDGPTSLDDLIRRTAVPRRTVEELLQAAGPDVEGDQRGYRLTGAARQRYRAEFGVDDLPADESGEFDAQHDQVRQFIDSAPRPKSELDHVSATPATVLARARWMRENYDLRGARVLCLGDHDLTSLALALVDPAAEVTVVDLDERVLAHIDTVAAERGLAVRTLHADFRFGLPPGVEGWADLVFTDPPYTPEGVGLFAARAARCCAGPAARILLAYGYSDRAPALGLKVQQQLLKVGLVFEAIHPSFHRYAGAQAIGSASDLYVCQPTSQARKLDARRAPGIYTRGPQAVESGGELTPAEVGEVFGEPVGKLHEPDWSKPAKSPAVFDLTADPGPWLLRMLLACNGKRAAFLVGNNHPDITSADAQRGLADLVGAKFALRFQRSTPDSDHALVLAESTSDESAAARLLDRAHGKLGNTWREALIATSGGTKRTAAEHVRARAPRSDDLDLRLIDLPRHRIEAVLRAATG
jgi:hypothetical protein